VVSGTLLDLTLIPSIDFEKRHSSSLVNTRVSLLISGFVSLSWFDRDLRKIVMYLMYDDRSPLIFGFEPGRFNVIHL